MKNRHIPIFVFIPLFLITISCSRQEKAEWKGTIEEVDGPKNRFLMLKLLS